MGTDSRKDGDKDRRTPVHSDGIDTLRRIEVITGTGRRRRWDAETKARLVAESFEPGRSVSEVARCHVVAIPTIEDEDAKRPNRERESLVGEQTRIVNRMKAALSRLGIRGFNPKLKKAAERLEDLRTPERKPIPPNTLAELRRDMERRRLVSDQIRQIEQARLV